MIPILELWVGWNPYKMPLAGNLRRKIIMKKILSLVAASLLFLIPSFSQDEDYYLEVDDF